MKLEEVFDSSRIKLDSDESSSEEILHSLVQLFPSINHANILSLVQEREEQMSTAIGNQIAIPHCRCPSCKNPTGAIIRLKNPINFKAMDKKPVRLFFLIINPVHSKDHIKILGKISRIGKNKDHLNQLFQTETPEQLMNILKTIEKL